MQIHMSATPTPTLTAPPRKSEDRRARDATLAFVFGEYRLDLSREQLIGPRGRQILRRKTFATLRLLLEAAPAVVSLDQLLDGVWGRHAISTSAVPNVIVELRHALGDSAQSPCYIETRHRRGYRMVAEVRREISSVAASIDAASINAASIDEDSAGDDPPPSRGEMHPLLALLDEIRSTSACVSPRRQLELLHAAANERGLTFLALQAQLALQACVGSSSGFASLPEEVASAPV